MKKTFIYSFKRSLPVLFGFLPLGIAYGILMREIGYGVGWTAVCSTFVLAGSLQFLMVSFFQGGFSLLTVALLSLSLNSRHIFYGLSFIEKFREYGPAKWFLIFTLTDESYSLHCAYKPEEGVNEKASRIISSAFVWFYWVFFSILGSLVGSLINFDTTGLDFALTALFATILVDQVRGAKKPYPALIAAGMSVISLLVFGRDNFILPALIASVIVLFILRPKIENTLEREDVK